MELRQFVTADDILVAFGHFLSEENIHSFDSSPEKMHRWFFNHRGELSCELHFSNRGFGPDSEELHQALSNLSTCRITYWKSNEGSSRLYFEPVVSQLYQEDKKDLLEKHGLGEEKLKLLAKSFAESCSV
ncbi:MAG: hypothetical protein M1429_04165 [Patescibacteria group bacterium]|nr:hypothetical protein [Patescibacteria group bacterium]